MVGVGDHFLESGFRLIEKMLVEERHGIVKDFLGHRNWRFGGSACGYARHQHENCQQGYEAFHVHDRNKYSKIFFSCFQPRLLFQAFSGVPLLVKRNIISGRAMMAIVALIGR